MDPAKELYKMSLLILLLTLTAVFCQQGDVSSEEDEAPCEVTLDDSFIHLICTNITDFSVATSRLATENSELGHLVLIRSPNLVLTREDFSHPAYQKLKRVDLLSGFTESFNSEPFRGLDRLQLLRIDYNKIATLGDNKFIGLDKLKQLILNYNQIETISDGAFTGLSNLENLDLSYNKLNTINPQMFNALTSLQTLIMDVNEITTIQENSFSSLVKLGFLRMVHNNITTISPLAFRNNPDLVILDLSHNQFESLDGRLFESNTNLLGLDLEGNNLENLSNFPLNIPSLRGIVLSSGNIHQIPDGYFNQLPKLEMLHIGHNKLKEISINFLPSSPAIRLVRLDNNKLTSMSVASFAQFQRIFDQYPKNANLTRAERYKVSWYNNPWNCSTTEMIELREHVQDHNLKFDELFLCNAGRNLWSSYFARIGKR